MAERLTQGSGTPYNAWRDSNLPWWQRTLDFLVGEPIDPETGQPYFQASVATPGLPVGGGTGGAVTRLTQGAGRGLPSGQSAVVTGVTRNARPALPSGQTIGRAGQASLPSGASQGSRRVINATGTPTGAVGRNAPRPITQGLDGASRNRLRQMAMVGGTAVAGGLAYNNLIGGGSPQDSQPNTVGAMGGQLAARRAAQQSRADAGGSVAGNMFANPSLSSPSPVPQIDPYQEFLEQQMASLAGAYDAQIDAIGGMRPLMEQMAGESQERIGGFFGHAEDTARAGIPVTQEIYGTAESNVGNIYDDLGGRLSELPSTIAQSARAAGGSGMDSAIADRVAAASAPFVAAGESSRANALANLTQHSSAGQNYLNQLASAAPAEGAMHQSAIDQALNTQLQQVAMRQAELEGAKQRALMEISSDLAGSSAEQMANQALAQALGLNIPGSVDPMDFLRGQSMIQGMQPDPGDPLKTAKQEVDLERAILNLQEQQDPQFQQNRVLESLSPRAGEAFSNLQRRVEQSIDPRDPGYNPRDMALHMLQELDRMVEEGNLTDRGILGLMSEGTTPKQLESELREAIRKIYS